MHDNDPSSNKNQAHKNYFDEIKGYYKILKTNHPHLDARFIFLPGDINFTIDKLPVITKTRPISNRGLNVLLPLNNSRHWKPVEDVVHMDIPWEEKKNSVIWRGAATGFDKRIPLVEKWYNFKDKSIDVGFTNFVNGYKGNSNSSLVKDYVSMKDMLKHKYIISVEGNDVASNLKWVLASNSVCIMPKPTVESWLMESKLIPWVHYVPVKEDFSDLYDRFLYCMKNEDKMRKIIKNSTDYMNQFSDPKYEEKLIVDILNNYCEKTSVVFR